MRGLIIYEREDYDKNQSFAKWLKEELFKMGLIAEILIVEEGKRFPENVCFVINRSRNYHLSLLYEMKGVPVFNNSRLTLLGNDKLAGYHFAKELGFPILPLSLDPKESDNLISKPIFGHGGEGIYPYKGEKLQKDYLYQKLMEDSIGDLRFYVIGNKIVHTVLREKGDSSLCANFSLGNSFQYIEPSEKMLKLVYKLISPLDIDFAGVDFLMTKDKELIFNEFEDAVGSRMLSVLGKNDTVPLFVEHLFKKIKMQEMGLEPTR